MGGEGGEGRRLGGGRKFQISASSERGGKSYGNAACPVRAMWKSDEVSLRLPSRAEAQSGTQGPRKGEFSRRKKRRLGSVLIAKLPARRGLSEARKPGSGLSLAEPGKLRLHDRDTVVQHRTAMSRNNPPYLQTREHVG